VKRPRSSVLLVVVGLMLSAPLAAHAQEITDPTGQVQIGTAGENQSGGAVCASNGGATNCIVGASTTGPSSSGVSVSGTGPAQAPCYLDVGTTGSNGTTYTCVAGGVSASGTGQAGTANCTYTLIGVSGTNSSCGTVGVSGTGSSSGSTLQVSAQGGPNGPVTITGASGALDAQFAVGGSLTSFPCPKGCSTTFSGSGSATGHFSAFGAAQVYDATFVVPNFSVSGSAQYAEDESSACPAIGSASGSAALHGAAAAGVVRRSGAYAEAGTVDSVVLSFQFAFERVGAAVSIVTSGATVQLAFHTPTESGTLVGGTSLSPPGAGTGVFTADPTVVDQRCASPGPLSYQVIGAANVNVA
jgi:hypothetical protein